VAKPTACAADAKLYLKFDDDNLKVTCVAVNGKVSGGIHASGLKENDENARSIALIIESTTFGILSVAILREAQQTVQTSRVCWRTLSEK